MVRMRLLFFLDALLLIAFAVLQEPRFTSLRGHEWIGVSFAVLIVVHLIVNWGGIVAAVARIRTHDSRRASVNGVLNGTLFIMVVVTVLSGLASSAVVLPFTGFAPSGLAA
jgi:cytochrome b